MRLMVCPRDGVTHYLDAPVTHFVSLIDPDETATTLQPPHSTERQLRLVFNDLDDIEMNLSNFARYCPPQEDDVVELVEFGKALSPLIDWGLLASCEAGSVECGPDADDDDDDDDGARNEANCG